MALPAVAEEIDFGEIPPANDNCCFLGEEYAELGVHFETTDDGSIWGGVGAGDPGEWRLEGSRGSAFLGFNGTSYEATVHFDEPVVGFALDVARAYTSTGYAELRVWGLVGGVIVERLVVPLGGMNQWITATLVSEVEAVRWKVLGDNGVRPYGIDHLRWELAEPPPPPEPELIPVAIDVVPFGHLRRVHLARHGVLPVVLHGSDVFDVASVDPETLTLGPAGAPALRRWWGPHAFDKNRDGVFDLLAFFAMRETGLEPGDGEVCVQGTTRDGAPYAGCQEVDVVESRGHRHPHGNGHPH
jgi:hypothetical protein